MRKRRKYQREKRRSEEMEIKRKREELLKMKRRGARKKRRREDMTLLETLKVHLQPRNLLPSSPVLQLREI